MAEPTDAEMIEAIEERNPTTPSHEEMARWLRREAERRDKAGSSEALIAWAILAQLEASRWRPIAEAPLEQGFEADLWCAHPQHGEMRSTSMCWDNRNWRDWTGLPLNPGWTATHFMLKPAPPATTSEGSEP